MNKTNIIIILILIIGFLLFQNLSLKNGITGAAVANADGTDILSRLQQFDELSGRQPTEIIRLAEPELTQLKQEQPVIYEGTKQGDYLVKYDDIWVVYDFENNKIIRDFVVQSLELGAGE